MPSTNRPTVTAGRIAAAWRLVGVAVVLAALWLPAARADDDGGQDRARQAVASGQILPLGDVLTRVEKAYPGKVLEVELEGEQGRWIYEVKLLQADGRLIKLKLNAKTAQVLRTKP
ncbi:MAG: PepSY domain-containing protein [Burkholderiaceae bacterium]|nr:PepSY domain-containing protein [Burkholderiaceae bacterium]